ncbi:hypothetical protein [uncultured Desulfovibrio sp.]|uniref:hypothetical protein n=1 Tax=uncultured Desulfovibrio sp. TaxID=167968 RepID=UPI002619F2F5|nr:hypothetical protein [uncultured Desulfovibrio sp.]
MHPAQDCNKRYQYAFQRMREKYTHGEKIRVGFSVIFDSVFPLRHVFELMLEDELFSPFLIAMPDISRGRYHLLETYIRTCASLQMHYPNAKLVRTYDPKHDSFFEAVSACDLYCPANPYDAMSHPDMRLDSFFNKYIPVFYTPYGPSVSNASLKFICNSYHKFWRFYAQAKIEMDILKSDNVRFSGFAKLDRMPEIIKNSTGRKKIIIAPHHSIFAGQNSITYGHFLQYSDLISRLPQIFPSIDFIFRPHPLLLCNLNKFWGEDKTVAWLATMRKNGNVKIQFGGDFLSTFVDSDALIHDCGSFLAEYIFTKKPCLYMWDYDNDLLEQFSILGKKCLDAHYIAYEESHILRFINDVVINGHDVMRDKRINLFHRLDHNYPNCSKFIMDDIKNEILDSYHN